jgi:phosphatidylglycerol---prolipoprotein diacylglyceryl transferase
MHFLYINWNPDPDIFTIPGIDWPVRWYGLMWALSFIASHFIMNRIYRTEGRTEKELDLLTVYIIAGTILGARLGHCIFYGPRFDYVDPATGIFHEGYLSHPLNILKVYEGGLASHGGAIGILVAMWLYCRKTKESWLWLFDKIVVVVPLAAFFIRFGNLMNSEIIGTPTTLPWGFIFETNETDIINLKAHGIPIPARHPAQLYEGIFCLFLFALMYWLWKNKRNSFGQGYMFGLMCVLLFTERFFDEFIKENQEAFENAMVFNMGQLLSIPFVIAGFYFMWRAGKKKTIDSGP